MSRNRLVGFFVCQLLVRLAPAPLANILAVIIVVICATLWGLHWLYYRYGERY